jgi:hypothetical protein
VYAALGAVAAAAMRTADLSVSPWRAAQVLGLFALMAASAGAVGHSRAGQTLFARAPAVVRDGLRTGAIAAALILAAGALAAGIALAVRGGDATAMFASYRTGVLGQAGVTVVCLAYAPNLTVWGAAYLLGPGFAVGVDTIVRPGEVLLGPLPALPPLAGLPTAPVAEFAPALLAAPVAAAMAAGWLLARRPLPATPQPVAVPWARLAGTAGIAGPVAAVAVQIAVVASAGGLGSGRLALLGPTGGTAALVAAVVVCAGVFLGASAARAVPVRAPRRPARR